MITDHIMASIADLAQEVSQYFASLQWERLGAMLSYNPSEPLLFSSGLFLFLFLVSRHVDDRQLAVEGGVERDYGLASR